MPKDPTRLHPNAKRSRSDPILDRREPLGCGEILGSVGVEKRIERFGRPVGGRNSVARGPIPNLAQALDDESPAQRLA
jgi:hypothetical protein